MGLLSLLWSSIFFVNAIAILNEERFLARIGWSSVQGGPQQQQQQQFAQPYGDPMFGGAPGGAQGADVGVKTKLIQLIGAVRTLMRIPLIAVNLVIIMYEVLLGS